MIDDRPAARGDPPERLAVVESKPREAVFAYGSLMHRDSLARTRGFRHAESEAAIPATIDGYQRCFYLPYPWWGRVPSFRMSVTGRERAAAALRPLPGGQVNGLLLWVDTDQLKQLDRREGVPWRYRRVSTTASPLRMGNRSERSGSICPSASARRTHDFYRIGSI